MGAPGGDQSHQMRLGSSGIYPSSDVADRTIGRENTISRRLTPLRAALGSRL
jgi:hypothetical protein